jgi:uncharacterized phage protein (TIGR02220 family)
MSKITTNVALYILDTGIRCVDNVGPKNTKDLIHARWEEGFTLVDFQKVIDIKSTEWLNDPEWNEFLRPISLFGPNFESYLNQKQRVVNREEDFGLVE